MFYFIFYLKKNHIYIFHDPESSIVMLILSVLGHRVIYDIHEDLVEDIKTKNYIPTFLENNFEFCRNH